jgi:hypothetical protein
MSSARWTPRGVQRLGVRRLDAALEFESPTRGGIIEASKKGGS